MNGTVSIFALALAGLLTSTDAWSWGNQGHQTIGAMADQEIAGKRAETKVKELLESGESLESVAIWADCAKGYCGPLTPEMKTFVNANPQHHDYHFADVPFELDAYQDGGVGTNDHDITKILEQSIAVLQGNVDSAANPHSFTPRQALLLIAHFVGDVHQPLHVGTAYVAQDDTFGVPPDEASVDGSDFAGTQGDNFFQITSKKNLHAYWDGDLVKASMSTVNANTPAKYATYLRTHFTAPAVTDGDVVTWPRQWANDTLIAAKSAHKNVTLDTREEAQDKGKEHYVWHVKYPTTYPGKERLVAQTQVHKAGYRLAQLLVAIWPDDTASSNTQ
jgi:hypothetical protein